MIVSAHFVIDSGIGSVHRQFAWHWYVRVYDIMIVYEFSDAE